MQHSRTMLVRSAKLCLYVGAGTMVMAALFFLGAMLTGSSDVGYLLLRAADVTAVVTLGIIIVGCYRIRQAERGL